MLSKVVGVEEILKLLRSQEIKVVRLHDISFLKIRKDVACLKQERDGGVIVILKYEGKFVSDRKELIE